MRTYSRKRPYRERLENPLELCRLCLGKVVQGMPVFNEESDHMPCPLSVRISLTLGIVITPDENLPNVICMDCYIEVHRSYIFLKQCEVSQQKLSSHIRAVTAKSRRIDPSLLTIEHDEKHKSVQTEQSMFNVAESTFILLDEGSLKYEIYNVVTFNGVSRTICTKLDQNLFQRLPPRYVAHDVEYSAAVNNTYLNKDSPNADVMDDDSNKMTKATIKLKNNDHHSPDSDTDEEQTTAIDIREPTTHSTSDSILPIFQTNFLENTPEDDSDVHNLTDADDNVFTNAFKHQFPKEFVAEHETTVNTIALALSNAMKSCSQTHTDAVQTDDTDMLDKHQSHGPSILSDSLKNISTSESESKGSIDNELTQSSLNDLTDNVIIMGDTLIPFTTVLQDELDSPTLSQNVNVSDAISNLLIDLGIVAQRNGVLVLEGCGKINLKTNDGENVTLQVVEETQIAQLQANEKVPAKEIPTLNAEADINEDSTPETDLKPNVEDSNDTGNNSQDIDTEQVSANSLLVEKRKRRRFKRNKDTWCEVCRKYFATPSVLLRHSRVHSGEKPYACDVCGRKFTQKEIMKRHELVHERNRPYQCDECPKSFTQRGSLTSHMRSHVPPHSRDATEHRCRLCPKTFMHASGLSRHMCAHSGRTYVCLFCDRAFGDKSSLLRHMKSINHIAQKHKVSDAL